MTTAALKPILSKLLMLGIKVRTIWITFLVGVLAGSILMLLWVLMLTYATDTALSLLARVS